MENIEILTLENLTTVKFLNLKSLKIYKTEFKSKFLMKTWKIWFETSQQSIFEDKNQQFHFNELKSSNLWFLIKTLKFSLRKPYNSQVRQDIWVFFLLNSLPFAQKPNFRCF